MVLNTTFYACFHVRVALLKCDFLRVPCTESWTSWAQMKAENLRNSKMGLHVPIAASKLELLASKRNRAFFLGHPVNFWTQIVEIYNSQRAYNYMRKYSQRAYLFCGSTSRMLKSVFGNDPDSATCSGIPKNIR